MAEYRIDELAQKAGTTVRNVRAYQERGLLEPPRRQGRAGVFGDAHLHRLRLISHLLERGYSLANISELLSAWENGHALEQLIGMWPEGGPLAAEPIPTLVNAEWLADAFGPALLAEGLPEVLRAAAELRILEPSGDQFRVTDARLLRTAVELARVGVPLTALAAHARQLRKDVEHIASGLLDLMETHVFDPDRASLPSPTEAAELAELAGRLRPLADIVVLSELGRAMESGINQRLAAYLSRVLDSD